MLKTKYASLVLELTSHICKHKELVSIKDSAALDLEWRLTQLFKEVEEKDEQRFINIAGMQDRLKVSKQNLEIEAKEKEVIKKKEEGLELSDHTQSTKNITEKRWVRSLYKRAVRRCHPDTLRVVDVSHREEIIELYKSITESYENNDLDILMVETYKLFIKPKEVIGEQVEILKASNKTYAKKIKDILSSQAYVWSTFSDEMKEIFLINVMKQQGVRFIDRSKVKEVIKRKVSSRKMGQKPENKLRKRVKNKK